MDVSVAVSSVPLPFCCVNGLASSGDFERVLIAVLQVGVQHYGK